MAEFTEPVYTEEDGKYVILNKNCERCDTKPGRRNICEGDGRLHGHGAVHTMASGLQWLCEDCAEYEKRQWQRARTPKREVIVTVSPRRDEKGNWTTN